MKQNYAVFERFLVNDGLKRVNKVLKPKCLTDMCNRFVGHNEKSSYPPYYYFVRHYAGGYYGHTGLVDKKIACT